MAQAGAVVLLIQSYRRAPKLGVASPASNTSSPLVTIIVPARDEERNIEDCLRSVTRQEYSAFEVVVVDDQSTDATAAIVGRLAAADPRLRPVRGTDPPEGWAGKPHALHQGALVARGELLLFLDADVRLDPRCLTRAVALVEHTGADLLTVVPRLLTGSFWERVVQPAVLQVILATFRAELINDPRHAAASANGPFLLFKRMAYEQIGGHQAVRGDIVEDLALARLVKQSGLRLVYAVGTELVSLRMYGSFAEIWNGWSKNFHAGAGSAPVAIAGAAAILALFVAPWLVMPATLAWPVSSPSLGITRWLASLGLIGIAAEWRRQLFKRYGVEPRYWYLQPLGFLIVAAILIHSLLRAWLRKPVQWRGRAVVPHSGGGYPDV